MIGHLVVELVTPAMIGGAVARQCDDPPTLRPPSLRGHLRFWSRALGGEELARELWGEEQLGQRGRLLSTALLGSRGRRVGLRAARPALMLAATEEHRDTVADMVPPGDRVLLRFGVPTGVAFDRLQAVLWTWLHLGSAGRRSRRGYGSLQWLPSEGDLLAGWPPLWPGHHLRSPQALAGYLEEGLAQVATVCDRPGDGPRASGDERLTTVDQVFVGKELPGAWEAGGRRAASRGEALEQLVHGRNERGRGGLPDRLQLGSAKKDRRPSPMMWRLFPVAGRPAYLPVMTWFPTGYEAGAPVRLARDGELYKHLYGDLGFEKSLAGNDLAG